MIKNAKFSGYYFDMNLIIWGDFQICISVPLRKFIKEKFKSKFLNFGTVFGIILLQYWGDNVKYEPLSNHFFQRN